MVRKMQVKNLYQTRKMHQLPLESTVGVLKSVSESAYRRQGVEHEFQRDPILRGDGS